MDIVVYLCQQCVEKALKGYLTHQDVIFQKTHNLSILLELCIPFSTDFENFRDAVETLTPYATGFRYPQDVFDPQQDEAKEALKMANSVLEFVLCLLPSDILTISSDDTAASENDTDA